jgi:REP element-mobilizing transposase RayT
MSDTRRPIHPPLAYLLTFRSYGTWLDGDSRGWVKRSHGDPLLRNPHEGIRRASERLLANPPVVFDARQRLLIHRTVVQVGSARGWRLLAVNVRTNHVHVVLSGCGAPEQMMTAFKACSTRVLRNEHAVGASSRIWARHGSTRYLWRDEAVAAACSYVRDQ